jgi:Carboxypeptidase regulatory-like domain
MSTQLLDQHGSGTEAAGRARSTWKGPLGISGGSRACASGGAGLRVVGCPGGSAAAALGADTASISGTVTSASGAKAIDNLGVCAFRVNSRGEPEETRCAPTNAEGKYAVEQLPAGEYKIEFSGVVCASQAECVQSYVTQFYNAKEAFGEAKIIGAPCRRSARRNRCEPGRSRQHLRHRNEPLEQETADRKHTGLRASSRRPP